MNDSNLHKTKYKYSTALESSSKSRNLTIWFFFILINIIVAAIGLGLVSFIIWGGNYVANKSSNDLTATGGAIFVIVAPLLPYFLQGLVILLFKRIKLFTNQTRALIASGLIGILVFFPLGFYFLQHWGYQFGLKGFQLSPIGFAIFYVILGLVTMILTVKKLPLIIQKEKK